MFVIICQSLFVCRHRAEMTIATTNESEKKNNANMLILFLIHPEWNSEMVISTFSLSLSYTWNGSDSFFFLIILVTLDSTKYLKQQTHTQNIRMQDKIQLQINWSDAFPYFWKVTNECMHGCPVHTKLAKRCKNKLPNANGNKNWVTGVIFDAKCN